MRHLRKHNRYAEGEWASCACKSQVSEEEDCEMYYLNCVKEDMDTYFLLAKMEYGDGNCEIPCNLVSAVRSLGY